MENWFPDYSWEHVSRKLAELGFKRRSGEKCKERFEEESRNLNNLSFNNKNLRFLSELDEVYQQQGGDHQKNNQNHENNEESREAAAQAQSLEEGSGGNVEMVEVENEEEEEEEEVLMMRMSSTSWTSKSNNIIINDEEKKRKRKKKRKRQFEMFKGFCEAIVERIMAQQEELHNKIIEDMMKKEEEKIARDEAWKTQETDRLNKEIQIREKEHEIASNRQAKIIHFLNNFAAANSQDQSLLFNKFDDHLLDLLVTNNNLPTTTPSSTHPHNANTTAPMSTKKAIKLSSSPNTAPVPHQNPTSNNPTQTTTTNPSFTDTTTMDLAQKNPTPESKDTQLVEPTPPKSQPSESTQNNGDIGKRWPREEVLALINLRCSLNNNNNSDNNNNNKDGGAKGPLWERISQGMQELGYNRSAKRCKEKWENINKYFRKTKDNNKKRSLDSRTCPYFHQLSTLYSQGKLRGDSPENRSSAD